jgi:hypothetical protein|tara:strand:+ start:4199 stop:4315 length:117 start_codon:yes stop_codon:yes gene_type:complete
MRQVALAGALDDLSSVESTSVCGYAAGWIGDLRHLFAP